MQKEVIEIYVTGQVGRRFYFSANTTYKKCIGKGKPLLNVKEICVVDKVEVSNFALASACLLIKCALGEGVSLSKI